MTLPKIAVCELPFLPCVEYLVRWQAFDRVIFDVHEHYVKQSYRNRCYILGANGKLSLTVPVQHSAPKMPFHEVLIDCSMNWQRPMWKSILSAYGKSPFFEFYVNEFEEVLKTPVEKLMQLNHNLLTLCLKCMRMENKFSLSEKYLEAKHFDYTDLRSKINPKRVFGENQLFVPMPYTQNFGSEFVPNLSVLDLIFCQGPDSCRYVKQVNE